MRRMKDVPKKTSSFFFSIFITEYNDFERSDSAVVCCGHKDINDDPCFWPDIICFRVKFSNAFIDLSIYALIHFEC